MKVYRERDITRYFESGSNFVFKDELTLSYTGPVVAWKNRFFAGTVLSAKIEKEQELIENTGFSNLIYDDLQEKYVASLPDPTYETFKITEKDIEAGFIDRYFMQMNNGTVYEVLKPLYQAFGKSKAVYLKAVRRVKIKQFTDHAFVVANTTAINEAEEVIPSIREHMTCFDTFQQSLNQYTSGAEWVVEETEESYIGFFHVMPGIGIMTGRMHNPNSKMLLPFIYYNTTYTPKIDV